MAAVDVVVALEHPTQDNWVTVGGDVVAIGTGYVVGKVLAGPIVRGVRSLLSREVSAEAGAVLPQTQWAVDRALHRAGAAADDELATEAAAEQAAAQQAKIAAYKARTPEQIAAEKAEKDVRRQRGAEKQRLLDEQNAEADAAKHQVPHQPSRTLPSRAPDPHATPTGPKTKLTGNAENQRGLRRENESATHAARAGYKVKQTPQVPGTKAPDFEIEDKIFDGYSPKSDNLRNIGSGMAEKVNDEQARRILLNLDDAPEIQVEDIRTLSGQLQRTTVPKLEEVWVWKNGQFHYVFP